MIAGFRRDVDEFCALLGWVGPMGCP